jgi:hypothetical protein
MAGRDSPQNFEKSLPIFVGRGQSDIGRDVLTGGTGNTAHGKAFFDRGASPANSRSGSQHYPFER